MLMSVVYFSSVILLYSIHKLCEKLTVCWHSLHITLPHLCALFFSPQRLLIELILHLLAPQTLCNAILRHRVARLSFHMRACCIGWMSSCCACVGVFCLPAECVHGCVPLCRFLMQSNRYKEWISWWLLHINQHDDREIICFLFVLF